MPENILLRRQGTVLELSVGTARDNAQTGGTPLPPSFAALLEAQLTYTHLTQLRGLEAIDPLSDTYRPIRTDKVPLYAYDDRGRLVCPKGFQKRVARVAAEQGHRVEVVSLDPEHPRPDRFDLDFDRVFDLMELRARQDECLVRIAENENGVIVAPTGFGKSWLMAAVCLMWPKARIHVITKRRDVSKRLYRHLIKYVPNVGQVGGGKKRWGRVTVVTADSMHTVQHDPQNAADVVLYDEVHEAPAPTYIEQLARYQSARMYGFTATPEGRGDNAHFRIEGIFGEQIFKMTYPEAVALGLVVPVKVEWLQIEMDRNPCADMSDTKKERWGIWRNEERNRKIAEKALTFDDDEQVLILVRSVEHAIHLKQHLPDFQLCYDSIKPEEYQGYVRNEMLDPRTEPLMTTKRRDEMQEQFETGLLKKVIATDVWSTGVDFPMLGVLIRADGRGSEIIDIQAPGRVVRRHDASGKQYGVVVDCMDAFDSTFLRRSNSRKRSYKEQEWEQKIPGRRTRPAPAGIQTPVGTQLIIPEMADEPAGGAA